jgi:general stress protein 26
MEKNPNEKRKEALSFLQGHEGGVLATVSETGESRARFLYYTCDDAFNLYFMTLKSTRKIADLATHPQAAFVVSNMDVPRTLQMEGSVTDLSDTATIDPTLVKKLMAHEKYGIPLGHFDTSELMFYKLTPTWIRWGDFTSGQGTTEVLSEIDPN